MPKPSQIDRTLMATDWARPSPLRHRVVGTGQNCRICRYRKFGDDHRCLRYWPHRELLLLAPLLTVCDEWRPEEKKSAR